MLRATVSRVTPSAHAADRVYVAVDRHQLGDFAPWLFVSEDRGASFRRIGDALPRGWVNDIVEHPAGEDLLVAGTEVGAFVSFDRGESWMRIGGGLPPVPVDDIEVHPRERDLVFGTHGRSIYVLDDAAPLALHDPGTAAPELFPPRTARIFLPWKDESYEAQARYAGANPPAGAILTVFLPDGLDEAPGMEIRDGSGAVLARPAIDTRPGFQRIVWDLRPTEALEGDPDADGICAVPPPPVAAGDYEVRLTSGPVVPLEVRLAPNTGVTEAQYAERTAFLVEVHGEIQSACRAARSAGSGRGLDGEQRDALRELRGGGGFRNPSALGRMARLYGEFTGDRVRQGTLHPPTPVHERRFARLRDRLREAARIVGAN